MLLLLLLFWQVVLLVVAVLLHRLHLLLLPLVLRGLRILVAVLVNELVVVLLKLLLLLHKGHLVVGRLLWGFGASSASGFGSLFLVADFEAATHAFWLGFDLDVCLASASWYLLSLVVSVDIPWAIIRLNTSCTTMPNHSSLTWSSETVHTCLRIEQPLPPLDLFFLFKKFLFLHFSLLPIFVSNLGKDSPMSFSSLVFVLF